MFRLEGRALIFGSTGGIGSAFNHYLCNKLGSENVTTHSRKEHGFDITVKLPDELSTEIKAQVDLTPIFDIFKLTCHI